MTVTASGARGRLACLGIAVLVLAVLAGGGAWVFRDDLFPPFGDDRACRGSELRLPDAIRAGGVPIPADAEDVHYLTRNGTAQVTFVSALLPGYLHRTGLVPDGADLLDERYGTKGVAEPEIPLPDGLCGSALRGPVRLYGSQGSAGSGLSVMVECSTMPGGVFRFPARTVVTFPIG